MSGSAFQSLYDAKMKHEKMNQLCHTFGLPNSDILDPILKIAQRRRASPLSKNQIMKHLNSHIPSALLDPLLIRLEKARDACETQNILEFLVRVSENISFGKANHFSHPNSLRWAFRKSDPTVHGEPVDQPEMIQNILFCLQNIHADKLVAGQHDIFEPKLSLALSDSTRLRIRSICSLGTMHKKIVKYHRAKMGSTSSGLVMQSFCGIIQSELTQFYGCLSSLHCVQKTNDPNEALTYERLLICLHSPANRLMYLHKFCCAVDKLSGGAMLSEISKFHRSGAPALSGYAAKVLDEMSKPIFDMIWNWVTKGTLKDPFGEFFIQQNENVEKDQLWQERWSIRRKMRPAFVSMAMAKNILRIGKTLNFLLECCDDEEWLHALNIKKKTLIFADLLDLSDLIRDLMQKTNQRLVRIMFNKYHLTMHIVALKKYLLLGQGDFAKVLLDEIKPVLDGRANHIYSHTCNDVLVHAIMASNAQYENKAVLDRLTVKKWDVSVNDLGWNIFRLDYRTRTPLNAIFHQQVMSEYREIFSFLINLKRVKMELCSIWTSSMSLSILSRRGVVEFRRLTQSCQLTIHEMLFFIRNMESYIMYDVLEAAWRRFEYNLAKSKSLDNIIRVHKMFVEEISVKCFRSQMGESETTALLRKKLDRCLHIILRACSIIGNIQTKVRSYEFKEPEISSLPVNSSSLSGIVDSYKNNSARADERAVMSNEASNGIMHLNNIKMEFRNVLHVILENMYSMSHCKLLTFQLNFNGFYDKLGFKDHRVTHESTKLLNSESSNPRFLYEQKIVEEPGRSYICEEKMSETCSGETNTVSDHEKDVPPGPQHDEDKAPFRVKKRKQACVSSNSSNVLLTSSSTLGEHPHSTVNTASNDDDRKNEIQSSDRQLNEEADSTSKFDANTGSIRSPKYNSTKTTLYFSQHRDLLNRITDLALKRRKRQGELAFHSTAVTLPKKRQRSM